MATLLTVVELLWGVLGRCTFLIFAVDYQWA